MPKNNTPKQFDEVVAESRAIFEKKLSDYGTAWRILRTSSLTDQVFIKANRIRTIQQKGVQKVDDGIMSEFIGILNYSIMVLIQLNLGVADMKNTDLGIEKALELYDVEIKKTKELMFKKNHDYGEAWRDMRISSMTDLILMKLLRVKQIEDNDGKTLISEGLDANFMDIINYAIFCLIKMSEEE